MVYIGRFSAQCHLIQPFSPKNTCNHVPKTLPEVHIRAKSADLHPRGDPTQVIARRTGANACSRRGMLGHADATAGPRYQTFQSVFCERRPLPVARPSRRDGPVGEIGFVLCCGRLAREYRRHSLDCARDRLALDWLCFSVPVKGLILIILSSKSVYIHPAIFKLALFFRPGAPSKPDAVITYASFPRRRESNTPGFQPELGCRPQLAPNWLCFQLPGLGSLPVILSGAIGCANLPVWQIGFVLQRPFILDPSATLRTSGLGPADWLCFANGLTRRDYHSPTSTPLGVDWLCFTFLPQWSQRTPSKSKGQRQEGKSGSPTDSSPRPQPLLLAPGLWILNSLFFPFSIHNSVFNSRVLYHIVR